MTSLFREKIREKIADDALQAALDGNAEKRVKARITAFASLPDVSERRQKAHAIRADVIEHLDDYLAQFIAKNEENGVIVHRAKDAVDAIQIVLDISNSSASQRGSRRISSTNWRHFS